MWRGSFRTDPKMLNLPNLDQFRVQTAIRIPCQLFNLVRLLHQCIERPVWKHHLFEQFPNVWPALRKRGRNEVIHPKPLFQTLCWKPDSWDRVTGQQVWRRWARSDKSWPFYILAEGEECINEESIAGAIQDGEDTGVGRSDWDGDAVWGAERWEDVWVY